jgi:UDP:flavonoid glycosyltransferase YjiC (YdhE family)
VWKREEEVAVKVLCAAEKGLGHTVPTLSIARQFRRAGCDVTMATIPYHRELVEAHGLTFVPLDDRNGTACIREFLLLLNRDRPEITICDHDINLWFALRICQPRCRISILRTPQLHGHRTISFFLPQDSVLSQKRVASFNSELLVIDRHARPFADFQDLCSGDIIAIPGIPQLDPFPSPEHRLYAGVDVIYTGPLSLDDHESVPSDVVDWIADRRAEGRVIVLLALGGTGLDRVYERFAWEFAQTEVAVVMPVPRRPTFEALHRGQHANVLVLNFSPLSTLMALVDVIIHQGGHTTVSLAFEAGKPSLAIRSGEFEREDTAIRMERLKGGVFLEGAMFRDRIDVEALIARIKAVASDPEIRKATADLSAVVREYRTLYGPQAVVDAAMKRVQTAVPAPA